MSESLDAKIAEYNKERNAMLMKESVDEVLAFMKKHGGPLPSSREAAEIIMHKPITAIATLPIDLRRRSKAWLVERNHRPLDDGDI
jgi:hypothetical protein